MHGIKPRYHYSPSLPLLDSSIVGRSNFHQEKQYDKYDKYADGQYSDLLSHQQMSWGSLEDRYILHEIESDDCSSFLVSSSTLNSGYSNWNTWEPVSGDEEKRNFIMTNNWGAYGLCTNPWDNDGTPVVKMRYSNEILLDDVEYSGFLTDRLVGLGSSFLSKVPESGLYVLTKYVMKNKSLCDISMLYFRRYLQYIDLSYNNISDLSALEGIPYLMYLNVSHNKLKHTLQFKPPWYLTYVNLSNNYIDKISDFSSFWSIVHLDLSYNTIEVISGLQNLKYLIYLNLSYNLIECIENLDNLKIEELNLEGNSITTFKTTIPNRGINILPNLRTINLSNNRLSSLMFFKDSYGLRVVDLKFNKINDLLEIAHLEGPISEIDLRGNRCTKWPNYKDVILMTLPSVTMIDGSQVSTTDKISAILLFASPLDLVAARSVTKLTSIEQLNKPRIDLHVKPYDEISPPLIVLTGPSAVKKVALAQHVILKLPDKVQYCRWHTTRELDEDNEYEYKSYIFTQRERFNDMAHSGDFLALQELLGNSYGFHHDQISDLIRKGKIGITQMDMSAALQMHKRYPNIKPILVLTSCEEVHQDWIHEKFNVFTWIRDSIENLFAVEIGHHKDGNICTETTENKICLVTQILNELIQDLELGSHTKYARPPSHGTTPGRISELENNDTKPTTRTESVVSDKRHITFQDSLTSDVVNKVRKVIHTEKHKTKGLKVLLDEESNIIRDDDESKRQRQRTQVLYRRGTLDVLSTDTYTDELEESLSSDETIINVEKFDDPEKLEQLKDKYTELVLKSRKLYMDHHINKPGFFSLVLFTDNYTKAFNILIDFIYELHKIHSTGKPILKPEMDYCKRVMIPNAVKAVTNEIQLSLSTAVLQRRKLLRMHGVSSWKNLMPHQILRDSNSRTEEK